MLFLGFFSLFNTKINKPAYAVTKMFRVLSSDGKYITGGLQTLQSITEQDN